MMFDGWPTARRPQHPTSPSPRGVQEPPARGGVRRLPAAREAGEMRCAWLLLALLVFGQLLPLPHAAAQGEKGDEKAASEESGDTKPAEKAASSTKTDAGGDKESGSDEKKDEKESYLAWMIRSSGVFGALIGVQSFVLVALIVMYFMQFNRNGFVPQGFIDAFDQKLQAKDYPGAYELARNDDSFVGKILTAGMGRLSRGYEDAIQGMQEVGTEEAMNCDHKLSYIALIASTAPMLGLLGTVQGMITSFRVIANSDATPKPKELADGVSTALFTTLEGLIVAIPAVVAYGLFKNRVSKYVYEAGVVAEGLMSRFQGVGKKPASTTSAPPA